MLCGRVVQWDVQNEFVRHHYFEERLGQPQITESLFATARQVDPDVALVLNDYEAAGSGAITKVCELDGSWLVGWLRHWK